MRIAVSDKVKLSISLDLCYKLYSDTAYILVEKMRKIFESLYDIYLAENLLKIFL